MEELSQEYLKPIEEYYIEDIPNTNGADESFDYFVLYNSNGWKRLEEYAISIKEALIVSTKYKGENESLASYGAKRLACDSTIDAIDNMLSYVKNNAETYNPDKK